MACKIDWQFSPCGTFCIKRKRLRILFVSIQGSVGRNLYMKATGIVRRIDDLGRVVIPKEIRRTMRIREGDPLEIYTEKDGEVIFKKYSPMGDMAGLAAQICESIGKNTSHIAAVCDRDGVVCSQSIASKSIFCSSTFR